MVKFESGELCGFLSDYSMAKLISLQTMAVRQCHRQKVPGANDGI